jgi:beta-aspartyl-peptidase (threonine type)
VSDVPSPTAGRRSLDSFVPFGCAVNVALFLGLVVVAILLAQQWARRVGGMSEAGDKARLVLEQQVEAWNRGDLDGFMAGYWNDEGLFYISGGKSVQGWNALKERYAKAYQGEGKEMGKLKFDELHVEPLGADAALVRGKWEVTTSKETVDGWFTLVFRKFPDGWKIVHDHTSK